MYGQHSDEITEIESCYNCQHQALNPQAGVHALGEQKEQYNSGEQCASSNIRTLAGIVGMIRNDEKRRKIQDAP